jgi:hypothetical protein
MPQFTPRMSALDSIAALLGFAVLVAGIVGCAVTGDWAGMIFVLPIAFGLMLFAGRGGRDGIPRRPSRVRIDPGVMLTRRGPRPFVIARRRRR